jgi:N-methylhydantoinase A/oxoprolinase/acetone carboxylase beta subunit
MNSIDIDVGGTFTDLVLNYNGKALIKKSPTTPYDLSVCFTRVIEDGAAALGMKIEDLLPGIEMIRYSTTIALNRLIEKKGPRLGQESCRSKQAGTADTAGHDRRRKGACGLARQSDPAAG